MNVAIIFAGGMGSRMHAKDKPKQFLKIHGKPIIVHTIEVFQNCDEIDFVIVVCMENWISHMKELAEYFHLSKVASIVPGGKTGQLSIFNGLNEAKRIFGLEQTVVLIHDGVRPLITAELISKNIAMVKEKGSAISSAATNETFIIAENFHVANVPERKNSYCAKAPQSFFLKDILEAHQKALRDGYTNMIDSCTLMRFYGKELNIVECGLDNIKITTPDDFYIFRALRDARENDQL